jgi:hypothetical protein
MLIGDVVVIIGCVQFTFVIIDHMQVVLSIIVVTACLRWRALLVTVL